MLGVVVAGGVAGVATRELLLLAFSGAAEPTSIILPIATMIVNVVGSFLLGVVVESLGDRHPLGRAFLGTGVLGGFTTYSAFAVQTATLLGSAPIAGIALALASVLLGLAGAVLGVVVARAFRGHGPLPATDGSEVPR